MKLEEILDNHLIEIINKYAEDVPNIGSDLKKSLENTKNSEIIVPVLGMQGMGKSTLINAILKENIMPNDADETTCVPVEVKFGTDEHGEVYFKDKNDSKRANSLTDLAKYVDNVQNPGNKLNVSHIVLYRNRDILKSGLILVDLPGVGSMTKENENTTKKYIENLCTAIFVIPTVPTIRNMEAVFIKTVWSQFANAIFVQNDFGESKKEIEESVEYNSMRLKEISESLKNPYNGEIFVVNAYDALVGALKNNPVLVEKSNVMKLTNRIEQLANSWDIDKATKLVTRMQFVLSSTLNSIEKKIEECGKSKDEIRKQREADYEYFNAETRRLRSSLDSVKSEFEGDVEQLLLKAKSEVRTTIGKIRAAMYNKIEAGIFDGANLSQAFKDEQETHLSVYFDDRINEINDLNFKIRGKIQDIIEDLEDIPVDDKRTGSESVDLKSKFKYEQTFKPAVSAIVSFAGYAAGAWAGGKLGAWAGSAVGSIIPGIGTAVGAVVGGLVGIVGGILGGIFGSKGGDALRKEVETSRISDAKKAINPVISDLEGKIEKRISLNISNFEENVLKVFEQFYQKRKEELVKLKNNIHNIPESEDTKTLQFEKELVIKKIEEVNHV